MLCKLVWSLIVSLSVFQVSCIHTLYNTYAPKASSNLNGSGANSGMASFENVSWVYIGWREKRVNAHARRHSRADQACEPRPGADDRAFSE